LPTLDALLAESASGQIRIVSSSLSIVEVAFGASEQKGGRLSADVEARINALWEDNATGELVEFYPRIAFRARALMRLAMVQGWSLKPADAIHLATAEIAQTEEFQTYDSSLAKYSILISMPILQPYIRQGRPS
jgi:predicted nucleic acid-binding protein